MNDKRRYILIFLTLSLVDLCYSAAAQNYSRDSLEIKINALETEPQSLKRDSTLAFFYNDMCEKCIYGNDDRADEFLSRFEDMYPELIWKPAEALYYRAKGKYFDKRGDYDKAIALYLDAIRILEEHPADTKHLTYTYIMAGFVLTNNGNEEACIQLFKKAEPLALRQPDKANIIWIYDYFGDYHYNQATNERGYRKALSYYLKVKSLLPESSILNQQANNFEGLGKTYWKLGEKDKAISYLNQGVDAAIQNNEGFNLWNLYSQLAYFKKEGGDLTKAIEYAKSGLQAAERFGYKEFISRSYYDLYELHKAATDYKTALSYFENNKALQDSLGRYELNARYRELESKYEFEKQSNEIEKLENERLLLLGYVILVLLVLGSIAILYYRWVNQKLKEQNELLNDKNTEIKHAIFKGSQLERQRVANDLHDSLSTKISALKWRIEAEEPTPLNIEVVGKLEQLYTDVRQIAHNMAAYELQAVGLIPSVENLLQRLNLLEKTEFTFQNELPENIKLEQDITYQIYCIVLELATNVLKHSTASEARLHFFTTDNSMKIRMSDNGSNTAQKSGGIGLKSLKNRVEAFNGTFDINKTNGFIVNAEIPI